MHEHEVQLNELSSLAHRLAKSGKKDVTALAVFGIAFSNLSQSVPFDSVDPMGCFVSNDLNQLQCSTYSHLANTPYRGQPLDANGGIIPKVGAVNGGACAGTVGGIAEGCPDFVAQTDPNSPFTPAAVPEPASVFLFGFGVIGLAAYRRRKKVKYNRFVKCTHSRHGVMTKFSGGEGRESNPTSA